jgi:hypothetical protein
MTADSYLVGSLAATGAAIVGGALVWLGHYVAARREPLVVGEAQFVHRWPHETRLKPYDQGEQEDTQELPAQH